MILYHSDVDRETTILWKRCLGFHQRYNQLPVGMFSVSNSGSAISYLILRILTSLYLDFSICKMEEKYLLYIGSEDEKKLRQVISMAWSNQGTELGSFGKIALYLSNKAVVQLFPWCHSALVSCPISPPTQGPPQSLLEEILFLCDLLWRKIYWICALHIISSSGY